MQRSDNRLRVCSLAVEDPRTADGGSRIRDYHIHRALAEVSNVTMFTFPPASTSDASARPLEVDVRLERPRHRVRSAATSLIGQRLYHEVRFDYSKHDPDLSAHLCRSDVVHVSMLYGLPAALSRLPVDTTTRPTVVWDTHNYDPDVWSALERVLPNRYAWFWRLQRRRVIDLIRRNAASVDLIICCSEGDAEQLSRLTGREDAIQVIPNGVEVDAWRCTPDPETDRYAIFGSLNRPQNVAGLRSFLAEVWPIVHEQRPSATLTVAGRNPGASLRSLLQDAPCTDLRPNPADLRAEIDGCTAVLVPQVAGVGSKLKLLAALATGLPVIATSEATIGIPPELLRFVRIASSPEEWLSAMRRPGRTDRELQDLFSLLMDTVDWAVVERRFIEALQSKL